MEKGELCSQGCCLLASYNVQQCHACCVHVIVVDVDVVGFICNDSIHSIHSMQGWHQLLQSLYPAAAANT